MMPQHKILTSTLAAGLMVLTLGAPVADANPRSQESMRC